MLKKLLMLIVAAVFGALLFTGCAGLKNESSEAQAPVSESTPVSEPASEFGTVGDGSINTFLQSYREKYDFPAVAAFILQGDEITEKGAVGERIKGEGTQVSLDDKWHIGSLTKAFTSLLAALLIEDNVLDWDTKIIDVFPELKGTILPEYESVDLVELLSHTGGIGDINESAYYYYVASTAPVVEQRRQYVGEILAVSAPNAVRGKHTYSNAGYTIAAAMFEKLTDKSWETLVEEHIFTPLGMEDTIFSLPGEAGKVDQPRGHMYDQDWMVFGPGDQYSDNPALIAPAGIMSTTLEDYSKFAAAMLEGAKGEGNLVSAESYEKIFTVVPDSGLSYALGWMVDASGVIFHTGSNTMWYAVMFINPADDYALFTVTNMGMGNDNAADRGLGDILRFLIQRISASK